MSELTQEVRDYMAKIGSKGGKVCHRSPSPENIRAMIAGRKAMRRKIKKWIKQGMGKSEAMQRWHRRTP